MVYRADGALTSLGTVARDSGASYVDGRRCYCCIRELSRLSIGSPSLLH